MSMRRPIVPVPPPVRIRPGERPEHLDFISFQIDDVACKTEDAEVAKTLSVLVELIPDKRVVSEDSVVVAILTYAATNDLTSSTAGEGFLRAVLNLGLDPNAVIITVKDVKPAYTITTVSSYNKEPDDDTIPLSLFEEEPS